MKITFERVIMILLAIAVFILLCRDFLGCSSKSTIQRIDSYIHADSTINNHKDSTIFKPEKINNFYTHSDSIIIKEFHFTDTSLIKQLIDDYFLTRTFKKTEKVDSIGTVSVETDVAQNSIKSQKLTWNLTYPTITITKTNNITLAPKREFYWGLGIGGNQYEYLKEVNAGLIYKDKKQHQYELRATVPFNSKPVYSISRFQKIGK